MDFPELNKSERSREYDSHSLIIRASVVYSYLFEGLSHRSLDQEIIGLDSARSKGWQSMGILHFLGLKNEHKGFFRSIDINEAINLLQNIDTVDSALILEHLENYKGINNKVIDGSKFEKKFQERITQSKSNTSTDRRARLENIENKTPEKVEIISIAFKRNADVIVEVLERANGVCEYCRQNAPFIRVKDGSPYLEVHHKKRLASGGEDTVDNAVALCPNCHRKAHFGIEENA